MRLIFRKQEPEQVLVLQEADGAEKAFAYADMVKELLTSGALEPPEIEEGFSDEEAASIRGMVDRINDVMVDDEPSDEDA